MAIRKMCCRPGCDDLSVDGHPYCEAHLSEHERKLRARRAKAKTSKEALAGAQLYATKAWRDLRKAFLKKNPLCIDCAELGLVVEATDVDHIKPHRGERALFFNRGNLQSLCKSCHSRKTAREVFRPGGVEK